MSDSFGKEELNSFRAWVASLTNEELIHAMEFSFMRDEGDISKSHEYELLCEMVQQQSPPPTPVHPRCLSFKPATQMGVTDGRDEEERVLRNRFRRPRLFKLIPRDVGSKRDRIPHSKRGYGKRRLNERKSAHSNRFDVFARKFTTAWGEVLSIGCTDEQCEADDRIVKGTIFMDNNADATTCAFSDHETRGLEEQPSCLNLLRVVSRGRFLSLPYRGVLRKEKVAPRLAFCAPWLEPVDDWFSLPMYLASRYEVALHATFQRIQQGVSSPVRNSLGDLTDDQLKRALCRSLVRALSTYLLDSRSAPCIRDTLIWSSLACRPQMLEKSPLATTEVFQLFHVTPLLETGSKKAEFRKLLQKFFREAKAEEIEHALVCSLTEKPDNVKASESPQRKKRSKKKRKTKQRAKLPAVEEEKNFRTADPELASDEDVAVHVNKESSVPSPISPTELDRNRNKVHVLAIIDQVLETVFDQVGVNDQRRENDGCSNDSNSFTDVGGGAEAKEKEVSVSLEPSAESSSHYEGKRHDKDRASTAFPFDEQQVESPKRESNVAEAEEPCDAVSAIISETTLQERQGGPEFDVPPPVDHALHFHDSFDSWGRLKPYKSQDKNVIAEFLHGGPNSEHKDDFLLASSTAASLASSSGVEDENSNCIPEASVEDSLEERTTDKRAVDAADTSEYIAREEEDGSGLEDSNLTIGQGNFDSITESFAPNSWDSSNFPPLGKPASKSESTSPLRSPSPQAPKTPPPQLSPILVSLADLKTLRVQTPSLENPPDSIKACTSEGIVAGSLPSSPVLPTANGLTPSWSREDLRISSFTDDQQIQRKVNSTSKVDSTPLSYRNAAAKALFRNLSAGRDKTARDGMATKSAHSVPDLPRSDHRRGKGKGVYAQSETAPDAQDYGRHWSEHVRNAAEDTEIMTTTKDGSTTISSALSPHESEDVTSLQEERNSFRDMCLTLGAEVAMLKNLLAVENGSKFCFSAEHPQAFQPSIYGAPSHGQNFMPPFFQGIPTGITSSRTVAALSDASAHRDHDSINFSEDGHDATGLQEASNNPRSVLVRNFSSAVTVPGSDASLEHTLSGPHDHRHLNREVFGSVPSHGMHSRLTKDIMNFLNVTSTQLRKQAARRRLAIERLSRLITALWPRAQVKLYGSHVSGTSLPSSDLDLVICLPAVHKNAPTVAPGVLEGRNAINETSQKMLARKLKGESWIDPNSIKIVERTAVPVIKVSTKDTRAQVLQLDISFDGPGHGGLGAIEIVTRTMQELPMIRPLILVLKQFLHDRGLLTAFTGGLSSYCLFLMIAKYLQEQPSSWGDCGSLLMGFLDFYGNSFDPRATGISVGRRQYFSRLNSTIGPPHQVEQPLWNGNYVVPGAPVGGSPDFLLRRHSFNENAANASNTVVPSSASASHSTRPPLFQSPSSGSPRRFKQAQYQPHTEHQQYNPYDHVTKPYTFDPLFVEDPLSQGNNVGRNAFRIFQVQRAFSDAHRALVASLEWDIYSSADMNDGEDYPLLKCLLQREDVFYELEDRR